MDKKSLGLQEQVYDFDDRPPNQAQFQLAMSEILSGARQAMRNRNMALDVAIPMDTIFTVLRACRTDDGKRSLASEIQSSHGPKLPEKIIAAVVFAALFSIDTASGFSDVAQFVPALQKFLHDPQFTAAQMPMLIGKLTIDNSYQFMHRVVGVLINPETDYMDLLGWKHYAHALFRGMPETIFDGNQTMQRLWAIGYEGIDGQRIPERVDLNLAMTTREQFRFALEIAKKRYDKKNK